MEVECIASEKVSEHCKILSSTGHGKDPTSESKIMEPTYMLGRDYNSHCLISVDRDFLMAVWPRSYGDKLVISEPDIPSYKSVPRAPQPGYAVMSLPVAT